VETYYKGNYTQVIGRKNVNKRMELQSYKEQQQRVRKRVRKRVRERGKEGGRPWVLRRVRKGNKARN